ncbi:sialidase family protein [Caulobacter sp. S45]|uniref:WD40/YVTN/BNR-like repeat-containing protein n=1 Tax=Caulobacter sp. S45 TaxID=1641861 RepID=UPI001576379C|nr:sialidase family protein [Caulobacter sp. S45]
MSAFKRAAPAAVIGLLLGAATVHATPDAAPYGDLHWRQLGPFRGGWATMVEGVADQPDTFYLAAAGGGLWRTTDAGRTWGALFEHGPAASVGAVAVAPSDPRVIYIGTGQPEPRYDVAAGLGVYRSGDGGATWSDLGLHDTRYIGKIWVDPHDPNTLLVGAQGHFFGPSQDRGVYRSTDGGRTWAHVLKLDDWTGVVDIAADPADPRVLFASAWEARQYPWQSYFTPVSGPGSAIYKSLDGGASWTRLQGGGWPGGTLGRIGLAVTRTAAGPRVYAAVDSPKSGGLYRSDDGGARWSRVNDEAAFTSWYASRLAVAPDDPDTVYTVGQSIRRCDQGGARCEIIKGAPGGDDYHHIWINPRHPDHLITGSDQGAVVSVNGGRSWSSWYNQPTGQFYHLAADDRFPYWIYSGQQDSGTVGIASRSDYGALSFRDWHPVGGDERDYDIPDPADPLIVYGSGLGGRVSKWDGRTGQVQNISPWPVSSYGKRPTLSRYHYLWVTPLVASRTGTPSIYLGAQVLFRSTDQGRSWATISLDLTGKMAGAAGCDGDVSLQAAKSCGYGAISAVEPSPRHEGEIWVGADDGLIQLTRDGGATWRDVTPPLMPLWAKVATLDVSALQDGVAYAVVDDQRLDDFQPHVLRTRDYGHTWTPITTGLPADHVASVVRADPIRPGLLYGGTDAGVYVSFDDGDHWGPLQQNLPTAWVRDLLVHDGDLIAATQGRALWTLDDLSVLRQLTPAIEAAPAHLFSPAPALRVRADENKDTPPPPETPLGENPPAGAVIDYWLGSAPKMPVVLEVRDAEGHRVARFASDDRPKPPAAERYFAMGWTRPPEPLPATPGLHRFVWNLRYPRPEAIKQEYSIAAVWGRDTPVAPLGPYVTPGPYQVVLRADGQTFSATLTVRADPRVSVSAADLQASLALSQRIGAGLARARKGYGETRAVKARLDVLFPAAAVAAATSEPTSGRTARDDRAALLPDQVRAIASGLRQPPAPNEPAFDDIDGRLASVESDLEAADAAPTSGQTQVVDDALGQLDAAWSRWSAFKSGPLAALNVSLVRQGRTPVSVPPADKLNVEAPDPGQDLP